MGAISPTAGPTADERRSRLPDPSRGLWNATTGGGSRVGATGRGGFAARCSG